MTIKKGTTTIAVDGSPYWGSLEGNLSEQTDLYNALNAKAPSLSPAFTGTPTAPTAPDGTNTTQIATTAFVKNAVQDIDALPDQTDMEGKYLATDGVNAYWKSPAGLPLMSFIWTDHILNDASFLRSDTFSWQSGSVYKSAYEHLVEDYNSGSLHTDTIGGVSVVYKLCADGHKICTESEMVNVEDFYAANGSAWYYILDTTNKRFKLPRTKYGFVGVRTIPGEMTIQNVSGVIDSENIVAETSNEMYLYFYVGNSIRNETTIDVGEITDELNNKIDLDFGNADIRTKSMFIGWNVPDYSSAVSIEHDLATDYICQNIGYYLCMIDKTSSNNAPDLKVNGVVVGSPVYSNTYDNFWTILLCDVGDVISADSANTRKVVSYFPPKGL